jgi:hypothetical protein
VGAIAGPPDPTPATAAIGAATPSLSSSSVGEATASPPSASEITGEPSAPVGGPSPTVTTAPTIQKRTVTETQAIPYATTRVNDPSLAKGTTKVRTQGVAGTKSLTYEVTLTYGVQTAKELVSTVITKQPVTQVIAVGTKVTQTCDPNYSGACVPIASDVDCAGGSGNGPAYVQGPVKVIGTDIYGLDDDGNGIGCE